MLENSTLKPVVTVIMATYNRSNILHYAVQSVLRQTETNWELLVIGDHCTDDTEAVMASFTDPRIRFINLETNVGEQSGPNNVGLRQARGEYIAFLNHDDMWFPDHLAVCLTTLRTQQADLVFAMGAVIMPEEEIALVGILPDNRYKPVYFVPASSWVFHRSVVDAVGEWYSYKKLWLVPSHDWLRRVDRKGKTISIIRQLTWLAIPSGARKNSYRERQSREHDYYFNELCTNPAFKESLLARVAVAFLEKENRFEGVGMIWQGLKNIVKKQVIAAGFLPLELRLMWQYRRKGEGLNYLRSMRGLPKLNQK
ncbi:glycosyltransferase family 2 protein [Spirosoma fluviale]|uniref:Glycosyltransferase involved in cell wall bisynthesis n=1 Tax=Spirosoma fluviale TaxID=1597977 RepID=A0A286GH82_9BACT|nr:glycosyltransferase family A protein [Spirosoma fluviale]SOD94881.1 Glycosyltransferase involved in cell wall bisynthesis [Spirosoma fluviale]